MHDYLENVRTSLLTMEGEANANIGGVLLCVYKCVTLEVLFSRGWGCSG